MVALLRVPSPCLGAIATGIVITPEGVCRPEWRNLCIAVFARSLHSLSGLSHAKEISVPIITISTNNRIQKDKVRKTSCVKAKFRELLVHHLDLLVDHLAGKPIDRDVDPVVLFSFHDEIVSEASSL